jgi:hypothetical protein
MMKIEAVELRRLHCASDRITGEMSALLAHRCIRASDQFIAYWNNNGQGAALGLINSAATDPLADIT